MWVIFLLFLIIVHDGGAKFLAEKIVPQQLRQFVALLLQGRQRSRSFFVHRLKWTLHRWQLGRSRFSIIGLEMGKVRTPRTCSKMVSINSTNLASWDSLAENSLHLPVVHLNIIWWVLRHYLRFNSTFWTLVLPSSILNLDARGVDGSCRAKYSGGGGEGGEGTHSRNCPRLEIIQNWIRQARLDHIIHLLQCFSAIISITVL